LDVARGFGFIEPDDRAKTGGNVFLHVTELQRSGMESVEVGDSFVSFSRSGRMAKSGRSI
jgi:cold shock CspA family protein